MRKNRPVIPFTLRKEGSEAAYSGPPRSTASRAWGRGHEVAGIRLLAGFVAADENAFDRAPESALLLRGLARMYRLRLGRRYFLA